MSRFTRFTIAATVLALSATSAPAQIYPLTNGPNGMSSNTLDSARGWNGINSVAPSRELLYHPERGGNAAAGLDLAEVPRGRVSVRGGAPRDGRQYRRRRMPRR